MIPIRDSIPASRRPVVTWVLIAITAVVFLLQLQDADGDLIERFGMVPARVTGEGATTSVREAVDPYGRLVHVAYQLPPAPVPDWLTLLTCVFLHGGLLHFAGNMWFLWIFGDNVEDRLGRAGFLCFYLLSGVLASLSHLLTQPGSGVPTVGASGAIAGVMGAYMLLYPHSKVLTLIPIFYFLEFVVLPAPLFLGIWFLLQFLQGVMTLSDVASTGVAWWAHIGGFGFGALVAWILRVLHRLRPPPPSVQLQRRRMAFRQRPREWW